MLFVTVLKLRNNYIYVMRQFLYCVTEMGVTYISANRHVILLFSYSVIKGEFPKVSYGYGDGEVTFAD